MAQAHFIARQIRAAFFGDNWCGVSLRSAVDGLTLAQANNAQPNAHSIAELVFHIGYYYEGVLAVLNGGPLSIKDKYSFDMPILSTESEWLSLLERTWRIAEDFAQRLESLSDDQMANTFVDAKYGDYYRNMTGVVEHLYYHLGQIVLLKKGLGVNEAM
jgi:hypothetical protein